MSVSVTTIVFSSAGTACGVPEVKVLGYTNLVVKCGDPERGEFTVEGLREQEDKCFTFEVTCPSCDGSQATTRQYVRCICETDDDCTGCESCVDSLCEPSCPEGEHCDDSGDTLECVECSNNYPCRGGKECVDSRCLCPQDKPYLRNGVCVECDFEGVENCNKCERGRLVPVVCREPGMICDPAQEGIICVECLDSSHCTGVNEVCVSRQCECAPGNVRDIYGHCVPSPECDGSSLPGDCQVCQQGKLVDIICPPGKVCLPNYGCVVSCDHGACPPGYGCVSSDDGLVRGCVPCGDCARGCGDGCFCDPVPVNCSSCSSLSEEECAEVPNCLFSGGMCRSAEEYCDDTVAVSKDATNIEVTLFRSRKIHCTPISASVVSKLVRDLSTSVQEVIDYKIEFRNGKFSPAETGELLNAATRIKTNSVVSGQATLKVKTTYLERGYDPQDNSLVSVNKVTEVSASFTKSITPGNPQLSFARVPIPKIGTLTIAEQDTLQRAVRTREVQQVFIETSITQPLVLESGCSYLPQVVHLQPITSNSAFYNFSVGSYGIPTGATLKSEDSRGALFSWNDGQKTTSRYVAGSRGSYKDTWPIPPACSPLRLSLPDSCAVVANLAQVSCAPEAPTYEISQCNQVFQLQPPFEVPVLNQGATYFISFGDARVEFISSNPPFGKEIVSTFPVNTFRYGIMCQGEEVCSLSFTSPNQIEGELVAELTPVCFEEGDKFTLPLPLTSEPTSSGYQCDAISYDINGVNYAPGGEVVLPSGNYTVVTEWACGCTPSSQSIVNYCCSSPIPLPSRTCRDTVCQQIPGVKYELTAGPLKGRELEDLCGYVDSLRKTVSAQIKATREGCSPQLLTLPALPFCCDNFGITARRDDEDGELGTIRLSYEGHPNSAKITLSPLTGTEKVTYAPNSSFPGLYEYKLTGLGIEQEYEIRASTDCGNASYLLPKAPDSVSRCDLGLSVQHVATGRGGYLFADSDTKTGCPCEGGSIQTSISSIARSGDNVTFQLSSSKSIPRSFATASLASSGANVVGTLPAGDAIFTTPVQFSARVKETIRNSKQISFAFVLSSGGLVLPENELGGLGTISRPMMLFYEVDSNPFTTVDKIVVNMGAGSITLRQSDFGHPGSVKHPTKPGLSSSKYRMVRRSMEILCAAEISTVTAFGDFGSTLLLFPTAAEPCTSRRDFTGTISGVVSDSKVVDKEYVDVVTTYSGLNAEDGCAYDNVEQTIRIDVSTLTPNAPARTAVLKLGKYSSARPKYVWKKDDAVVYSQYPTGASRLPSSEYASQTEYTVEQTCGCTEIESITTP